MKQSVTDLPRLTRGVWTSFAVARGTKAGALALVLVASATTTRADVPSAATLPPVDHYVRLSFLPKASELVQDAKKNNLTILRIDELADRVIVSYKYPDGRTATLGYTLLGTQVEPATNAQPVAVTSSANVSTARYTVADRDPEVIYVSRPSTTTVYYSDPYPYYSAWAPLTVGFGLGWSTAYYGNYYRPYHGYYGGGHYHGGGHKHGGYHGGGYKHGGYRGGGSSHGGSYHSSGGYGRGSSVGYNGGRGGGGSSRGSHGGGGRGSR